ncbi:MAG: hypothetical protein ACXVFN_07980 [Solirubrobacteraceae bacterium]
MAGEEPTGGVSPLRVGLGIAAAATDSGRAVAGAGLRVAAFGWRRAVVAPVRRPVGAVLRAADQRGARDEPRVVAEVRRTSSDVLARVVDYVLEGDTLERLVALSADRDAGIRVADAILAGEGAERLVSHVLEQPALDELIARAIGSEAFERRLAALLDDPALERLLARALASRFADTATEQVLASEELHRVVAHIAASEEVRAALQSQSMGMATEVAGEVRGRTATADDKLEHGVRRLLRRSPRSAPVTEVADDIGSAP